MTPAVAIRSSTRLRAAWAATGSRSGLRLSGACGNATSKAAFGRRQPRRLLAEIGEACRPDALEITAIGRQHQVERQDFILAEAFFQRQRKGDLAELAGSTSRRIHRQ